MIHELTRDDLEYLLGVISYELTDGYVVSGLPKEVNGADWIYSQEYWATIRSLIDHFQKRIDKRYGKIN